MKLYYLVLLTFIAFAHFGVTRAGVINCVVGNVRYDLEDVWNKSCNETCECTFPGVVLCRPRCKEMAKPPPIPGVVCTKKVVPSDYGQLEEEKIEHIGFGELVVIKDCCERWVCEINITDTYVIERENNDYGEVVSAKIK